MRAAAGRRGVQGPVDNRRFVAGVRLSARTGPVAQQAGEAFGLVAIEPQGPVGRETPTFAQMVWPESPAADASAGRVLPRDLRRGARAGQALQARAIAAAQADYPNGIHAPKLTTSRLTYVTIFGDHSTRRLRKIGPTRNAVAGRGMRARRLTSPFVEPVCGLRVTSVPQFRRVRGHCLPAADFASARDVQGRRSERIATLRARCCGGRRFLRRPNGARSAQPKPCSTSLCASYGSPRSHHDASPWAIEALRRLSHKCSAPREASRPRARSTRSRRRGCRSHLSAEACADAFLWAVGQALQARAIAAAQADYPNGKWHAPKLIQHLTYYVIYFSDTTLAGCGKSGRQECIQVVECTPEG